MITITHTIKPDGVEICLGDDKVGGGMKMFVKREDFLKLEENLGELFKMAENYINLNYISLHERKNNGQTNYVNIK